MIFQSTVYPTNLQESITLNLVSPLNLTINPKGFYSSAGNNQTTHKIVKIDYDFGDGSPIFSQKIFYGNNVSTKGMYLTTDPGDPRNYPTTHLFNSPPTGETVTYNIKIRCYWVLNGNLGENFADFYINLNLKSPILASNPKEFDAKYAEDIHLVSSYMFGPENYILYNLQTYKPTYLAPVLVKWVKPPTPSLKQTVTATTTKRFKLLSSFEIPRYVDPETIF